LERIQLRQQEAQISFICGMLRRGHTPINNIGDGNCVFISLAQIVVERLLNPKRLERIQLRQQEAQISFIGGMLRRGHTPINNIGDGNCVFISLAQIVVGDTAKFQFMRQMIVRRLRNFQTKYDDG